jgi:ribonuclease P protein component
LLTDVTTMPSAVQSMRQAADFERVLRTRSRSQTPHFAAHHVPGRPLPNARQQRAALRRAAAAVVRELSTGSAPEAVEAVDESLPDTGSARPADHVADVSASVTPFDIGASADAPSTLWLGTVVPKRHARRAVTRSLLKRQIRHALARHAGCLAPGLWVVRLRAPFDRARFPSAASDALKRAARDELDTLFGASAAASPAARG